MGAAIVVLVRSLSGPPVGRNHREESRNRTLTIPQPDTCKPKMPSLFSRTGLSAAMRSISSEKLRGRFSADTENMNPFLAVYILAALWSTTDDNDEPLDKNYETSDISPETLAGMEADCNRFQTENSETLTENTPAMAGHDFWLTRNRHGAGFWDGGWPINGDGLTEAAHSFGEVQLYVDGDGKIYA